MCFQQDPLEKKPKMLGHGIHICIGILKMKLYHQSHYHEGVVLNWIP